MIMDDQDAPQATLDDAVDAPQDLDNQSDATADKPRDDLPKGIKERIARQEKKHQREMREMQAHMAALTAHLQQNQNGMQQQAPNQNNDQQGNDVAPDIIQRAVREALSYKDREAAEAKKREKAQQLHEAYQELNTKLDKASDKYEDFDDVVRGNAPFTDSIRDAALLIDNPADVLYRLGKNPEELKRLSSLPEWLQAREVNRLSKVLSDEDKGASKNSSADVLDPIRNNPAMKAVTDPSKMSIAELRQYKKMRRR